jgi:hypothetical protein
VAQKLQVLHINACCRGLCFGTARPSLSFLVAPSPKFSSSSLQALKPQAHKPSSPQANIL